MLPALVLAALVLAVLGASLLFLAGAPRAVTLAYLVRAAPLVFAAQAATAALGAVLLFLWLGERMRARHAFAGALVFALNPGSVVLVWLLQYGVLHATGIVAALWALALRRPRLPLRSALVGTLVLCGAGAAVLAPWMPRNLAVSGRFVPVNPQGRANLWGATVKPLPTDIDAYRWQALGEGQLDLLERVSGRRAYDPLTYVRRGLPRARLRPRAVLGAGSRRRAALEAGPAVGDRSGVAARAGAPPSTRPRRCWHCGRWGSPPRCSGRSRTANGEAAAGRR